MVGRPIRTAKIAYAAACEAARAAGEPDPPIPAILVGRSLTPPRPRGQRTPPSEDERPAKPFTSDTMKGNTSALKSGHRSDRVVGPLAQQLADAVLKARPDLARYPAPLARWSSWEARAMLLRARLDAVGDLDADGELRRGLTHWLTTSENNASREAAKLGLDPTSEAALARARASAGLVASTLATMTGAAFDSALFGSDGHDAAQAVLAQVIAEGRRELTNAEVIDLDADDDDDNHEGR